MLRAPPQVLGSTVTSRHHLSFLAPRARLSMAALMLRRKSISPVKVMVLLLNSGSPNKETTKTSLSNRRLGDDKSLGLLAQGRFSGLTNLPPTTGTKHVTFAISPSSVQPQSCLRVEIRNVELTERRIWLFHPGCFSFYLFLFITFALFTCHTERFRVRSADAERHLCLSCHECRSFEPRMRRAMKYGCARTLPGMQRQRREQQPRENLNRKQMWITTQSACACVCVCVL